MTPELDLLVLIAAHERVFHRGPCFTELQTLGWNVRRLNKYLGILQVRDLTKRGNARIAQIMLTDAGWQLIGFSKHEPLLALEAS